MKRPARMTDVAYAADVSIMTVSRVLNNHPSVTEETRERVLDAIRRLNYQRNELARSLREQRTRQIGILIPSLVDPFFANCAQAISMVAKQHNYSVVIATTDEDPESELDEARRMLNRDVEGVIAIPAERPDGTSHLLSPEFANLPIVVFDRPLEGSECDSVVVQNKRGAQMGTEYLISLGHKRIACISLGAHLYTMRLRQQGYRAAMTAANLDPEIHIVTKEPESTAASLRKLMHGAHAPSAIFSTNNLVTRRVLHALRALKMSPPNPALVGFDDFETADLLQPGITVVRQPTDALGRAAADALFARIAEEGRHAAPKRILLPVELIVRGSCGARVG